MNTMKVMINGKEEDREIDHYEREGRTMTQIPVPVLRKGEVITKTMDGVTHIFPGMVDNS